MSARLLSCALALAGLAGPAAAQSDAVAEFYRGKTIHLLIGVSAGGEYDLHARLVARHIGRHIPGQPTIVAQNMVGAGGLTMTNHFANVAPKDGTTLAMVQNGFPAAQALSFPNIQFDTAKFNWIGAITPTVETIALWRTAGVASVEEAKQKEVVIGAVGRGSITFTFPRIMNELFGTRFKIVTGYPGGNDINVAMERGEVAGRNNTWSSWKVTKAHWLKNKDISIIVYGGPPPRDLPGVPNIEDLAKSEDDRRVIALIFSGTKLGRPITASPGAPPERVAALRAAFMAAMKDPELVKEAEAANIEIDPVPGETLAKVVADVLATPANLKERARPLME